HPRRAGGGLPRRPRGGDVGAARPHQDHRRHQVRQEQPRRVQGQALRRQGGRDLEPGARRGDQGAGGARAVSAATTTLLRYLPLLLLAIGWETASRLELVSSSALPSLTHVAEAWVDLVKDGELIVNG